MYRCLDGNLIYLNVTRPDMHSICFFSHLIFIFLPGVVWCSVCIRIFNFPKNFENADEFSVYFPKFPSVLF